jgi:hypothetical protein
MKYKHLYIIFAFCLFSCKQFEIARITKLETISVTLNNNYVEAIGNIIDVAENGISDYGFCYAENKIPTIQDSRISFNECNKTGEFSAKLVGLNAFKTYLVRAYAISNNNVKYGQTLQLNVTATGININTDSVNVINSKLINLKGSVNGIGGINILDFGMCWSLNPNPTLLNYHVNFDNLNSDTTFNVVINNPILDTTYHIRTFAQLDANTFYYSPEKTIRVNSLKIRTYTLGLYDSQNISLNGFFDHLGADPIQEFGFCWSTTNSLPNLNDERKVVLNTPALGSFSTFVPFVNGNTYYSRAYAIVNGTVIYGNVQFKAF